MKILAETKRTSRPGDAEVVLVRSRRNSKQVQLTANFLTKAKLAYMTLPDHGRRWAPEGDVHVQMIAGIYRHITKCCGINAFIPIYTGLKLF